MDKDKLMLALKKLNITISFELEDFDDSEMYPEPFGLKGHSTIEQFVYSIAEDIRSKYNMPEFIEGEIDVKTGFPNIVLLTLRPSEKIRKKAELLRQRVMEERECGMRVKNG